MESSSPGAGRPVSRLPLGSRERRMTGEGTVGIDTREFRESESMGLGDPTDMEVRDREGVKDVSIPIKFPNV